MKGLVTLNQKEQKRLMVLNLVMGGGLGAEEAAQLLGLSVRQIRRLLAGYLREGAGALAHGNRGRKPVHALDDETVSRVVELAEGKYRGVNQQQLSEYLEAEEGLAVSRSSVRRILLGAGVKSCRHRRPPKHRSRRERYPQAGMLLQIDASPHDWLEGRGPRLALIAGIDDATGEVPHALFRESEDAQGYFELMRGIVSRWGRPLALYHDAHGIFKRSRGRIRSIEEELAGSWEPTQFGRLLKELEISSITAHSPQAKGRIERLFRTLQDRLVSELRLKGAGSIEEANRVLGEFLPKFNGRFGVEAKETGSAYRAVGMDFEADKVFCFKYRRVVGLDNVVNFYGSRIQVLATKERLSYARAKVEVHERLDGGLAVCYQGKLIAKSEAPAEAPKLRARNGVRGGMGEDLGPIIELGEPRATEPADHSPNPKPARSRIPSPHHPWRTTFRKPTVTNSQNT